MNVLSTLFSCVNSKVKLLVFAMNSMRRYSIFVCFIYGLEEKNSKSEVIFTVCRLPLTSCLTSLIMVTTTTIIIALLILKEIDK